MSFTEVNLLTHPAAIFKLAREYKKIGPMIIVNGGAISAFNRTRLIEALGLAGTD